MVQTLPRNLRVNNYELSIIGMGYVGLTTAACFAAKGKRVLGVEVNKDNRENVMSELIINCHFVPKNIFDDFLKLVRENIHEVVDKIKDSFIDFQKFFELFSIPLRFLPYQHQQ